MQSNLEARIYPLLTPGETILHIETPNPHPYAQPTVLAWLGAVTLSTMLALILILWIDTLASLLLLFVPPLLLLVTAIVKQDKVKEALHVVYVTTDRRRFTVNTMALAQAQQST